MDQTYCARYFIWFISLKTRYLVSRGLAFNLARFVMWSWIFNSIITQFFQYCKFYFFSVHFHLIHCSSSASQFTFWFYLLPSKTGPLVISIMPQTPAQASPAEIKWGGCLHQQSVTTTASQQWNITADLIQENSCCRLLSGPPLLLSNPFTTRCSIHNSCSKLLPGLNSQMPPSIPLLTILLWVYLKSTRSRTAR